MLNKKKSKSYFTSKAFLLISVLFLLSACSEDPYEKYLGFWKLEKENKQGWVKTMQINKDGDSFLLKGTKNKGGLYKPLSSKEEVIVLKKSEGQLLVETGFGGGFPLGLSEDKNTLRIDKKVYKRITSQLFDETNKKMKEKIISFNANQKKCDALKGVYSKEWKKLFSGSSLVPKEKQNIVREKYKAKVKTIPNCNIIIW